ncbi:MAG TPA: saccharopine dehydrogenase NADP-binding domain-containing protein, partial [Candidatus Limnocylindrales bacterium]|nr:saccharopine dehydrogenase NADP-binding domain-containing protein [Candidatus Limnocylindrales bacterium]
MKIALLGAAGFIGRIAAQALSAQAEVGELLLVDYNIRDAKRFAKALSPKCRWAMADVARAPELARLLTGVDAVANAVGPCAEYEKRILLTCAEKGTPAASIGDGTLSAEDRREVHDAFRLGGSAAVSGCGMMPGWTELLSAHF